MTQYIYPQNLKAKANLWLWGLRDFVILSIAVLISVVLLVHSGMLLPAALSMCFAVRYFITTQQSFEWR